ncbi:uncharacterized protein N7500_007329 [Penicillium coprophilum]|uniref:uncharacterized protein n=1 Tax=Penicillium coprophilum TaxID=36646 RepID=UPI00238FB828|nr:uncharacterized protein N7500_007329 [Penicillium coprophilum]KAJ5165499.1 hypothetical protein N7500_007329 [Penicillium coprophilum]
MDNHPQPSASPGSSNLPSGEDITDFINEPTDANESAGANQSTGVNQPTGTDDSAGGNDPVEPGPSNWSHQPSLEILQAHLAADDNPDSDSSEPPVHPDFYIHLARLQRINEANRVNARREAEAQHQAHQASLALYDTQHQASPMFNDPQRGSSQLANDPSQSLYDASAERRLQPSPMDMPERYETQPSTEAGLSEPIPHDRYETPDPTGSVHHPQDLSSHHQPPSPYPMAAGHQASAGPSTLGNPPTTAPQRPRYTEYGNPYTLAREPDLVPEGAIPYSQDRILQAWLIRQQLIAGIRPENLQPMSNPRSLNSRTPPWIVINDSGAHIIRMRPARFHGVMLPMPDLPWFPRRANPNSSTAPASSTAPGASSLPATSNIQTAPSSGTTQNLPVGPDLSAAPSSPAANSPVGPNISAAQNTPVDTDLPTATDLPVAQPVRAAANPLAVQPVTPHVSGGLGASAPPNSPVGTLPQVPMAALQSQIRAALTGQNRTDTESISSQETPGAGAPPASSPGAAHGNGASNGNGAMPHGIIWEEPEEDSEDSEGPVSPHLRRFLLDGGDDQSSL